MLIELFKNKGSPSLRTNYRDILLANDDGKGEGKLLRRRFLKFAMAISHDTQFGGGFHGGETAFAHLYMRLLIDSAIANKTSCSAVYFDVVAAFASMLRRIIFSCDEGDEHWLHQLQCAGFSEEDIQIIYDSICNLSWLTDAIEAEVDKDIYSTAAMDYRISEQMYRNSWVSQEYIPNVLNITSGSSAGTPLADLIYSVCMARIITKLRDSMVDEGLTSSFNIGLHNFRANDVSFVDDLSLIVLDSASNICDKVAKVANCAYTCFLMFGMLLNFSQGKSECTIGFFGAGQKQAKRKLASDDSKIPIKAGKYSHLRVVSSYQHVGTHSSVSYDMHDEVCKRSGMMRTECRMLCKKLLHVEQIPTHQKLKVVQTYVLSKGLFQCSTWPELPDTVYKRFHSTIIKMYRDVSCLTFSQTCVNPEDSSIDVSSMFSDDDVIYKHGFICPRTMLRFSKLMLFTRILKKTPPHLCDLILAQAECKYARGWTASLTKDLKWLCDYDQFNGLASAPLSEWICKFNANSKKFVTGIRNFCKLPYANICTQWATSRVLKVFASPIECGICGDISKSLQAHSVHQAREHNIKCKFRTYVGGNTCRVCLKCFSSRECCINHAKKSKVCRVNLIARGPTMTKSEADSLDEDESAFYRALYRKGRRRHYAEFPVIVASGPLLPIIPLCPSAHHVLGFGHNYHR